MQKKLIVLLLTSSVALSQETPPAAQNEAAQEKAEIAALNKELKETAQQEALEQEAKLESEMPAPETKTSITHKAADDVSHPASPTVIQETVIQEAESKEVPPIQELPATEELTLPPQETVEDEEIEIKNINTVDIREPKGNWLYKRIWWEKAERVYEKIKQLADKIMEFRLDIFNRRNDLNRIVIDPFYSNLGIERGDLEEVVTALLQNLEEQKKRAIEDLEEAGKSTERIEEKKKLLEELQEDAQKIAKIDRAIDDALMKLVEQTNQIKYYEQQAWESFKAINRELSDKKARELYYAMDTYWKNLNNINNYLSDPYSKYFDQLIAKIQQEIENLKNSIQSLSQKGINLAAYIKRMKASPIPAPDTETQDSQEPEEDQGFARTIWGWIKAPFIAIGSIFSGIYDSIARLFSRETISDETDIPQTEPNQQVEETE